MTLSTKSFKKVYLDLGLCIHEFPKVFGREEVSSVTKNFLLLLSTY